MNAIEMSIKNSFSFQNWKITEEKNVDCGFSVNYVKMWKSKYVPPLKRMCCSTHTWNQTKFIVFLPQFIPSISHSHCKWKQCKNLIKILNIFSIKSCNWQASTIRHHQVRLAIYTHFKKRLYGVFSGET